MIKSATRLILVVALLLTTAVGKTVAQKMGTFAGIALAYACGMIYLIYYISDTDWIVLPVTVLQGQEAERRVAFRAFFLYIIVYIVPDNRP